MARKERNKQKKLRKEETKGEENRRKNENCK
jgi:hypothetical protein